MTDGHADLARGGCAERFMALLERERAAATGLRVDDLAALQTDKRALLDELGRAEIDAPTMAELRRRASFNVTLIRQLVQGLSGLVGVERPQTYNATGRSDAPQALLVRGAV